MFEYKIVSMSCILTDKIKTFERLGKDNWDFVALDASNFYIFKRWVDEPSDEFTIKGYSGK